MDYKNGRVYCIRNAIDDDIYVGSTCQPLSKRIAEHRKNRFTTCKKHFKLYKKMDELGVDNFYIELIKECPCENKEQLRAIEGEYIRLLGTLNSRIEGRTDKQYCDETKETRLEYFNKYRADNEEAIQERHIKYREKNRDRLNEKARARYELKKQDITVCEVCGHSYKTLNTKLHEKTQKHQQALNNITNNEDNISDNI